MSLINLTPKEFFRVHETLPAAEIEKLLDAANDVNNILGIEAYMREALGCFTAEDMLSNHVRDLHQLTKTLRGDNKEQLLGIIDSLEDFLQCQFNQADYGRDELRKAIAVIENLKK